MGSEAGLLLGSRAPLVFWGGEGSANPRPKVQCLQLYIDLTETWKPSFGTLPMDPPSAREPPLFFRARNTFFTNHAFGPLDLRPIFCCSLSERNQTAEMFARCRPNAQLEDAGTGFSAQSTGVP